MTAPRTLLEALVRQRQLSWDEAARAVSEAAREQGERGLSLSSRHLARLARRERLGEARPNPATCRALQYAFGRPIEELLAPFAPGDLVVVSSRTIEPALNTSEVLTVAADRARRFMSSLQTMSDESMALVQEDVRDLAVDAYNDPSDPDWAFGDAAGSRTDLAIARLHRGEIEGAAEIVSPVLALPAEQRINGIVHSVNRVGRALDGTASARGIELQQEIENYTRTPLRALAR